MFSQRCHDLLKTQLSVNPNGLCGPFFNYYSLYAKFSYAPDILVRIHADAWSSDVWSLYEFLPAFPCPLRRLIVLVNLVVAMWAVCHVVECRRIVDNYCTYCLASLNKRLYGVATLISLRLKVVQQRRVRTKPSWFLSTRTKERQNTTVISFRTMLGLFGHRGA